MEAFRTRTPEWAWHCGLLLRARLTMAVVALVVGLFGWVEAWGGVDRFAAWYLQFGLRRADVLDGKIWQMATHAALHGSWWHVGLNAALLWWCGARAEHVLGWRAAFRVLVLSVLGGAVAHLLLVPGGLSPLVGISGGVMGLLLMMTTLSPQSRMLLVPVSAGNLGLGVLIANGLLACCNPDLGLPVLGRVGEWAAAMGWGGFLRIGHACHFGGAVTGWLLARAVLRPGPTLADLRAERRRRENPRN